MSGQPHARAALPARELRRYLFPRRLGGTQIFFGQNCYSKESIAVGRVRIAPFPPPPPQAVAILFVLFGQFKYLKTECTRGQNIQFSTNKNACVTRI